MSEDKKYQIQKRDNFRVNVYSNIIQKIVFDRNKSLKAQIVDISLGGCRIHILMNSYEPFTNYYKMDHLVSLKIELDEFSAENVEAKIKFMKINPQMNYIILGLEFEKLLAQETQDLQKIIFKLERQNRPT